MPNSVLDESISFISIDFLCFEKGGLLFRGGYGREVPNYVLDERISFTNHEFGILLTGGEGYSRGGLLFMSGG